MSIGTNNYNDTLTPTTGTLAIAGALSTTTALSIGSGGTGQTTASTAFNALSPITSTGDLIIGNGTNSATRLAIGANNYVLTSNGTTASWAAPAGSGGMTLLATLTPTNGASSIAASSLAAAKMFVISLTGVGVTSGSNLSVTLSDGSTSSNAQTMFSTSGLTSFDSPLQIYNVTGGLTNAYASLGSVGKAGSFTTSATGRVTQITFTPTNTFNGTGNIYIYGIN